LINVAKQELKAAKTSMKESKAKHPTKMRCLQAVAKCSFLEPYGVCRRAYHGGDYNGPAIKSLMANAGEIFNAMEDYLLELAIEKGVMTDDKREQLVFCLRVYKSCLQNFDAVFSRLRNKNTKNKQEVESIDARIADVKQYLVAGLKCWRKLKLSVMPKVHLMEDHLLHKMVELECLEHYDEEFVERAHQKGVAYNKLVRGAMRDPVKWYIYMSCWEHAKNNKRVLEIREKLQAKHRKRPHDKEANNAKISKKMKHKIDREEGQCIGLEDAEDEYMDAEDLLTATELNLAKFRA